MSRLLVLGCSQAKRHEPAYLPALERYDGPAFRVLRKAHVTGTLAGDVRVRIVSAEYGLLGPNELIRDYDRRLTPECAREIAPAISQGLIRWLHRHDCHDVFVNLGRDYLPTVAEFLDFCGRAPGVSCLVAAGGTGVRAATLKTWLERGIRRMTCPLCLTEYSILAGGHAHCPTCGCTYEYEYLVKMLRAAFDENVPWRYLPCVCGKTPGLFSRDANDQLMCAWCDRPAVPKDDNTLYERREESCNN